MRDMQHPDIPETVQTGPGTEAEAPSRAGRIRTAVLALVVAIGAAGHTPEPAHTEKPSAKNSAEPGEERGAITAMASTNAQSVEKVLAQEGTPTCVETNADATLTKTSENLGVKSTPEITDTFWQEGNVPFDGVRTIVVDGKAHIIAFIEEGKTMLLDGTRYRSYVKIAPITLSSVSISDGGIVLNGSTILSSGTTKLSKNDFEAIIRALLDNAPARITITSDVGISVSGTIKNIE